MQLNASRNISFLLLKRWIMRGGGGEAELLWLEKNARAMKTSVGDFVRAPTRIINHRSNAHFGRWARQMWSKINIKNPFPPRTVFHHAFYRPLKLWRRMHGHICVHVKSKFADGQYLENNSRKFNALAPFSLRVVRAKTSIVDQFPIRLTAHFYSTLSQITNICQTYWRY